jgi:hypothetical protein
MQFQSNQRLNRRQEIQSQTAPTTAWFSDLGKHQWTLQDVTLNQK